MTENPFVSLPTAAGAAAAPAAIPSDPHALFRDGKLACTPLGARWPARCVRCNAEVPAAERPLSLTWTPPWVYLLLLGGVLLAVIAQLIVRRSFALTVGYCPDCAARRRCLLGGWTAALALGLVALCGGNGNGPLMAAGVVLAVLSLGGLVVAAPIVQVARVRGDRAWIRAGAAFVASLPAGQAPPPTVDPLYLGESRPTLDD